MLELLIVCSRVYVSDPGIYSHSLFIYLAVLTLLVTYNGLLFTRLFTTRSSRSASVSFTCDSADCRALIPPYTCRRPALVLVIRSAHRAHRVEPTNISAHHAPLPTTPSVLHGRRCVTWQTAFMNLRRQPPQRTAVARPSQTAPQYRDTKQVRHSTLSFLLRILTAGF